MLINCGVKLMLARNRGIPTMRESPIPSFRQERARSYFLAPIFWPDMTAMAPDIAELGSMAMLLNLPAS